MFGFFKKGHDSLERAISEAHILAGHKYKSDEAIAAWHAVVTLSMKQRNFTEAARGLCNIARIYNNAKRDHERSVYFLEQATSLANSFGPLQNESRIFLELALIWMSNRNKLKAHQLLEQALPSARSSDDPEHLLTVLLIDAGTITNEVGRQQRRLELLNEALPLTVALGQRKREGHICAQLAAAHIVLASGKEGEYMDRAQAIAQSLGDQTLEAQIWHDVGLQYFLADKDGKTEEYFKKCLSFWSSRNHQNTITALSDLAELSLRHGKYTEVLNYSQQALEAAEKTDDETLKVIPLCGIAAARMRQGSLRHAAEISERALAISRAHNARLVNVLFLRASIFTFLGETLLARQSLQEAQR